MLISGFQAPIDFNCVSGAGRSKSANWVDPDAITQTYLSTLRQSRSAWTWEVELRPWVENF
ncbi:hypothetical protein VB740_25920 [Nostoc sp. UHCC 0251]|nr:hypothetical protein [Nostoc sp. UHCC 0251]